LGTILGQRQISITLNKWLTGYNKGIYSISRVLNFVGVIILTLLMLLTVADVFMRRVFNKPILASFELTEYLMTVILFFTIAWATVQGKLIRVDLFIMRLPSRTQLIFDLTTCILSLAIAIIITWRSFVEMIFIYELQRASLILKIPAYPFYFMLAIGCIMLCLAIINQLIIRITHAVKE
jgi:TRAP-type C4-dicarboxylate transport system permease small subunit